MTSANTNSTTRLLVVEGANDAHTVLHLCKQAKPGLEETFCIRDAKGFQGVLETIRGRVNQQDVTAVGFVVDADDNPQEHWKQVRDRIADANREIALPEFCAVKGAIIPEGPDGSSPRIGVWLMPDNSSPGELEDFVARMIPEGDSLWPLSEDYINNIPMPDRKFADAKIVKSQVHAWLAASKYPGLIGLAIREGDLTVNGALARRFLAWLTRLFR